jgi:hypothetical protein
MKDGLIRDLGKTLSNETLLIACEEPEMCFFYDYFVQRCALPLLVVIIVKSFNLFRVARAM